MYKKDLWAKDRRQGPDLWVKLITWLGIVSWSLLFVALILFDKARPETEWFFDRFFKVYKRQTWDFDTARLLFIIMLLGLAFSLFGFAVNLKRSRRKKDYIRAIIVFPGLISLAGIITYLFF